MAADAERYANRVVKIQPSIEESFDISRRKIIAFLDHAATHDKNSFLDAICNLMQEALREIEKLLSIPPDLTYVGIGTRNIIELYLISRHILADEKWLNNWIGQMHKDTIDIQDGFLTLMKKHEKNTSELEAIQKYCERTLQQSDFESSGQFNMRELAKTYGHDEDYVSIHKLCSKLVHPTSMKVNAFDALTANANYYDTLRYVASYFAIQIENLIDEIRAREFA